MKTPILYVGAPGVGKTAKVRQKYDHCEVLLLSSQSEEDVVGIPYRDGDKEKRTVPPYIQRLQGATGTKCLFLDEIDKARREVADTLLTLVTHPQLFGIPEGTDIVAAANPPEWGGGDGLSLPMINRFSVINFTPDFEEWASFISKKYGSIPLVEQVIEGIRSQQLPFLESNGDGLDWRMTSPRSIDAALSVLINEPENSSQVVMGLVTPNMGSGMIRIADRLGITNISSNEHEQVHNISRSVGSAALKKVFRR